MLTIIFITLIICFIFYLLNREIDHIEFIVMCIISVVLNVVIFNISHCLPNDIYYMSGRYIQTEYHPYFVEEYEDSYETCTEDDDGNESCTTYYTTEREKHYPYYLVRDSLGQYSKIDKSQYEQIAGKFGNHLKIKRDVRFNHSDGECVSGDSNLYYYVNETNTYEYPTTKLDKWHNPIKHSNSIFNTTKDQYKYPERNSWTSNNRNLNNKISNKDLDILNTKIYERIGANVILVETENPEDLKYDWNSGKKNDIIICFNKDLDKVKVFGWYETELLSAKLEQYILDNGINLKGIEHVILSYYKPFDFSQFKYISKPDPMNVAVTFFITFVIMIFVYCAFASNDLRR